MSKYKPILKTTPGQREKLRGCHPGVGLIAYKFGNTATTEAEFYVDPKGQLRYVKSGAPLMMEVLVDGRVRVVEITSQFAD